MNCEWTKENLVLYIYDELADDARYEFEQHTHRCPDCRRELESALGFKGAMSERPVEQVSPNLLAASRLRLQEALDHAPQAQGWQRFAFDFAGWMHQLKLSPALTAVLLMIGFAGGSVTTWRALGAFASSPVSHGDFQPQEANIAGIESITADANSNKVAIQYDLLYPQTVEGAPNDPRIQQLLLMAARNTSNSGVRLDSVEVLTRQAEDNEVREALIASLHYDKNPGVRLRALDGLKSFVKDDTRVRDAIIEALMNDSNAGIRSEAISLLEPVRADMSVREALQQLARHDRDRFIRSQSSRYLESMPNLY